MDCFADAVDLPPPMTYEDHLGLSKEDMRDTLGDSGCGGIEDDFTIQNTSFNNSVYQEAEKIRKWQVEKNMELTKKAKELEKTNLAISNLRSLLYQTQTALDDVNRELYEEKKNRTEVMQKLDSTRKMCFLLEEESKKLKEASENYIISMKCSEEEDQIKMKRILKLDQQFDMVMEKFHNVKEEAEIKIAEIEKNAQEKVDQFQNIATQKEKQVEKLNEDLNEISLLLEKVTDANNNLMEDMQNMEKDRNENYDKFAAEIKDLKTNSDEVTGKLEAKVEECNQLQTQIQDLKSEIESKDVGFKTELKQMGKNLRETEEESNQIAVKLEEEISRLNGKIKSITTDKENMIVKYKDEISVLQDDSKTKETSIYELKQSNKNLEGDIAEFKSTLEAKEAALLTADGDKVDLENEVIDLKNKVKKANAQDKAQIARINRLEKDVESKNGDITELEEKCKQLMEDVEEDKTMNIKAKEKQSSKLETLKADIKKFKEDLKAEKNAHKESKTTFKKEKKVFETQMEKLQKESSDLTKNFENEKEEHEKNRDKLKTAQENMDSINKHFSEYQTQLEEKIEHVLKLERDLGTKDAELAENKKQMETEVEDKNHYKTEFSKKEGELTKSKNELSKKESELSKQKHELLKKQKELTKAQNELLQKEAELTEKENELIKMKQEKAASLVKARMTPMKTDRLHGAFTPSVRNPVVQSTPAQHINESMSNLKAHMRRRKCSAKKSVSKRLKVDYNTPPSQSDISLHYDLVNQEQRKAHAMTEPRSSTPKINLNSASVGKKTPSAKLSSRTPASTRTYGMKSEIKKAPKKVTKKQNPDISWLDDSVYGFFD